MSTSLVALPAIAYLLTTGIVSDFEGFGITAKFRVLSEKPVVEVISASELVITDELADDPNFFRDSYFQACRPYYVLREDSVPQSNTGEFDDFAVRLAISIRSSIICGELEALVVLDSRNKVLGFFRPNFFYELLRIPLETYNTGIDESKDSDFGIADRVLNTELGPVLSHPVVRAESADAKRIFLSTQANLIESLATLRDSNSNVALLTNSAGEFRGIVTRRLLVDALILSISEAASKNGPDT